MEALFKHLEREIRALIAKHLDMQKQNQQLQQDENQLMRDNQSLRDKQDKAIIQIETLISKLKAIENKPS